MDSDMSEKSPIFANTQEITPEETAKMDALFSIREALINYDADFALIVKKQNNISEADFKKTILEMAAHADEQHDMELSRWIHSIFNEYFGPELKFPEKKWSRAILVEEKHGSLVAFDRICTCIWFPA